MWNPLHPVHPQFPGGPVIQGGPAPPPRWQGPPPRWGGVLPPGGPRIQGQDSAMHRLRLALQGAHGLGLLGNGNATHPRAIPPPPRFGGNLGSTPFPFHDGPSIGPDNRGIYF